MEKIVFAGFGEIGQSVYRLYDPEKYQLFAIDPIFNNIKYINNSNQESSVELYRVLKGVDIKKNLKTLMNLIELSKLQHSSVTDLLRVLKSSVTESTGSKTTESISFLDYSHNIDYHNINILNIGFGYSDRFEEFAVDYIKLFNPELVIVHSTVPIGTCRAIYKATGVNIAHSPVIGKHPNLTESILTFDKAVSGINEESIEMACSHLNELEVTTVPFGKLENTELAKMLSTSYYAHCIDWMRDVKQLCDEQGTDFELVYNKFNNIYNKGYSEMGMFHFVRPVLTYMEGGFSGHCVRPNLELLKDFFPPAKILAEKDDIFDGKKKVVETPLTDCSRIA